MSALLRRGLEYLCAGLLIVIVAVVFMDQGKVVEEGPAATLFASPRHPYTQTLLAASPRLPKP